MAQSSLAATSDELSVPLLHNLRGSGNGKEKEERRDTLLDIGEPTDDQTRNRQYDNRKEKKKPNHHVIGIRHESKDQTHNIRKEKKKPHHHVTSIRHESNDQIYNDKKENGKEESHDIHLDIGEQTEQTCKQPCDDNRKGQTVDKSRDEKRKLNKPTLVSIGPKYVFSEKYFKGDALSTNTMYKARFFKSFLKRGVGKEEYLKCLEDPGLKLMKKARKYYKDLEITYPNNLDDTNLVDMLLIDGGFVVEFVLRCKKGDNDDPRIKDEGKQARIDMLLFENQLPFEILDALYQKLIAHTKEKDPPSFIRLVKFAFASLAPNVNLSSFFDDKLPSEPRDLLHVVYSLCIPTGAPEGQNRNGEWPTVLDINSATELREVGVSFSNAGKVYTMPRQYDRISSSTERNHTSLFDVTFSGGVMKIPSFKVDDSTEVFFQNMIALEQRCRLHPKYYTDYARLMDHLVDTDKDVSLLRKNGAIHNLLGEDKKVADVFNTVCVEVGISTDFYFAPVYTAVNGHCRNTCLVWMAKLKNDYFSNPWKGISTVAGGIVLLLGAALTTKSLLS